jgi:ferredoxin
MIIAELKPFQEIKDMLKDYRKILIIGCGACVTVCMSGGEKQVELLASAIRMARKLEGKDISVTEQTLLRQCDPGFIDRIKDEASQAEAVLSMGCGAGVQGIVEKLDNMPVLPALNTRFIGIADREGNFSEKCMACGNCILARTGGICPVSRCAKSLINGPCGGAQGGLCEASKDNPCVWQLIYARLEKLNMLHLLKEMSNTRIWPVHPQKLAMEETGSIKE